MGHSGIIWLVGMMGAGKSTVGPALARRLGRPFLDTDAEIESARGCSVAELFARDGEDAFRRLEAEVIRGVPEGAVVALGGGAIAQPGAPERLAERGTVVYLKASPEQLLARIGDGSSRPLLRGLSRDEQREELTALLARRRSAYESAAVQLETGEFLEPEDPRIEGLVTTLVERLGEGAGSTGGR